MVLGEPKKETTMESIGIARVVLYGAKILNPESRKLHKTDLHRKDPTFSAFPILIS